MLGLLWAFMAHRCPSSRSSWRRGGRSWCSTEHLGDLGADRAHRGIRRVVHRAHPREAPRLVLRHAPRTAATRSPPRAASCITPEVVEERADRPPVVPPERHRVVRGGAEARASSGAANVAAGHRRAARVAAQRGPHELEEQCAADSRRWATGVASQRRGPSRPRGGGVDPAGRAAPRPARGPASRGRRGGRAPGSTSWRATPPVPSRTGRQRARCRSRGGGDRPGTRGRPTRSATASAALHATPSHGAVAGLAPPRV